MSRRSLRYSLRLSTLGRLLFVPYDPRSLLYGFLLGDGDREERRSDDLSKERRLAKPGFGTPL